VLRNLWDFEKTPRRFIPASIRHSLFASYLFTWIITPCIALWPTMVKKGQAKGGKPGGGGAAKKASPATTGADDSFIVFSNSDKDPKPKRPANNDSGTSAAGPSGQDGPALAGEAPKRPDVKKLIGGASWTGKLPVNMLSEHCQKQKWEKPEYTMVRDHKQSAWHC
jgi:hypothetical protein